MPRLSNSRQKRPILFLVGPTAVGKSEIAVCLAKHLNGEIISADSMQIYRGMDIGTAKPTPMARRQVKHHMIDIECLQAPLEILLPHT